MRTILGIVLGVVLTVGVAYIYDANHALSATTGSAVVERPLVNWDIAGRKWEQLTIRVRGEWNRLIG